MGKYKKAILEELKWLDMDIEIIDAILKGEEKNINNYTEQELRDRRRYACNEISRLTGWVKKFSKDNKNET